MKNQKEIEKMIKEEISSLYNNKEMQEKIFIKMKNNFAF